MKKDFDLLSLGEILLRLSPPNNERIVRGETFQKQVGGAELNVVSGVSLLGLRTGIISKLPDNALGTYAKNRVRFCGVSDDYLVYDEDPDARLGIYYYENGAYPRKPSVVYDRRHASFCTISICICPVRQSNSTSSGHPRLLQVQMLITSFCFNSQTRIKNPPVFTVLMYPMNTEGFPTHKKEISGPFPTESLYCGDS